MLLVSSHLQNHLQDVSNRISFCRHYLLKYILFFFCEIWLSGCVCFIYCFFLQLCFIYLSVVQCIWCYGGEFLPTHFVLGLLMVQLFCTSVLKPSKEINHFCGFCCATEGDVRVFICLLMVAFTFPFWVVIGVGLEAK